VTIDAESIRATSYLVELAVQVPTLVALAGAAAAFKRPGMPHLAWAWTLLTAVSAISAAGLVLQGPMPRAGLGVLVGSFGLLACGLGMLWYSIDAVVGGGRDLKASLTRSAVAATALTAVLAALVFSLPTPAVALMVGRVAYVGCCIAIAVYAARTMRRHQDARTPLGFLALAGMLGAARIVVRTVLDLDARQDYPMFAPMAVLVAAVLHQGSFSIAFILSVLTLERRAMASQGAALTRVELELSAGRRLESLGKMASAIAHDFNNVLTAIKAGVESAEDTDPVVRREGLRDAAAGTDRARDLATRLLAFARARPAAPMVLDLGARLTATVDVWRRLVPLPAQLHVTVGEAVPPVRMDPVEFDQVVLNLVTNAADALSGAGWVRVTVSRRELSEADTSGSAMLAPGRYACLCVEDTGTGMPREVVRNAFEPFFTTKGEQGTGLGLATVLAIVHGATGSVIVNSCEGQGTRIDVLLPAV
jgi:signal transduction histidine kinase